MTPQECAGLACPDFYTTARSPHTSFKVPKRMTSIRTQYASQVSLNHLTVRGTVSDDLLGAYQSGPSQSAPRAWSPAYVPHQYRHIGQAKTTDATYFLLPPPSQTQQGASGQCRSPSWISLRSIHFLRLCRIIHRRHHHPSVVVLSQSS